MSQFNENGATHVNTNSKHGAAYYLLQVIRVIVGVLFIFSGLIKANDPSGLAYKMEEFFELWHMTFLAPYALIFSIAIIAFEIIAGVAVLLGYFFKQFAYLLLLLMIFFTYLTAYAVWYEYVNHRELKCGCFGDCIPLTAHQSFMKDIILLVFVILLVIGRKHIKGLFTRAANTSIMILALAFSIFIQWYVLEHLPFVDCLPFKVGNNILKKMQPPPGSVPDEYDYVYPMKNIKTGASKEMSNQEYMDTGWKDTLNWQLNGEPKQILIKKGNNAPEIKEFSVQDAEGNDLTETLLKEPGYNFLFFVKNVEKASTHNIEKLRALFAKCEKSNVGFYLLTANSKEETEKFIRDNKLNIYYYSIDATVCKTAMRTNPGLMLIKAGTILGKWSYNDYPSDIEFSGEKLIIKK
ncbi:DoxX family protein [Taibaiella lutea]|uniref:DoxX family protein n=1 Tax=Taibaiella lutea TaxID=2608001 RepID=A0A5M6CNI0_9BACT|nr:BT_3928 family protein [Taibaiella lutea]KAA5536627.1 DoxX family protein [Taibaiella lutea]